MSLNKMLFDLEPKTIYLKDLLTERWQEYFTKELLLRDWMIALDKLFSSVQAYYDLDGLSFYKRNRKSHKQSDYYTEEAIRELIQDRHNIPLTKYEYLFPKTLFGKTYTANEFLELSNNYSYIGHYFWVELFFIRDLDCSKHLEKRPKLRTKNIYFKLADIELFEKRGSLNSAKRSIGSTNNKDSLDPSITELEYLPAYLDHSHAYYSSELAMCIELWQDLFINQWGNQSRGVQERVKDWLTEKNNQSPSTSYLKKICSIVNHDDSPYKTKK